MTGEMSSSRANNSKSDCFVKHGLPCHDRPCLSISDLTFEISKRGAKVPTQGARGLQSLNPVSDLVFSNIVTATFLCPGSYLHHGFGIFWARLARGEMIAPLFFR